MKRSFDDVRIRLIQIRMKPEVEQEERQTFIKRCQIRPDQLLPTNALKETLDERVLENVDAVMIGGAGAYSVTRTYSWTHELERLIHLIDDHDLPLFGSCWGHQFLARAYGGRVIHDPERAELGCGEVELTPAGLKDELFGTFPPTFQANMGHHDRVDILPECFVELAYSAVAPYQAFRVEGKPIYGTQFHSELDATAERQRIVAYRDHYPLLQDPVSYQQILASLEETTEVDHLLNSFIQVFAVSS
jgi:GMP synthase (glutamine-hydrolysing)